MPGDASEVRCVELPPSAGGLRVALLPDEPPGKVSTRSAGRVEFEAVLEWPPGWTGEVSVLALLPTLEDGAVLSSLEESASSSRTTVRGGMCGPDEERLSAALDGLLRAASSVAAVREAALRTRVERLSRPWCPQRDAVQSLARYLWREGFRVGFGATWSPAAPGADVMLGCRGAQGELAAALSARRLDRAGSPG